MPDVAVIIAAGGAGKRMGGKIPKQFLRVGKQPIIARTVLAFDRIAAVGQIIIVVPKGYAAQTRRLLKHAGPRKPILVIEGGKERQDSVRTGLDHLSGDPGIVLIHDAVRPFVTRKVIQEVIRETARFGAAVVGVRVKDTIKKEGKTGFYESTLPRHLLWAVQTPQGFKTHLIKEAHARAISDSFVGTDDAILVERLGFKVRIVQGEHENAKITTKDDLLSARRRVGGGV
ncbi:MAG TPA: 2-C-methyl-D-erythritol 4-phosphate cytidylyltransferase [Bacteroidota bacterium]|nr:2-C-methyl-D-erythritol 4-phosphate cytidylyltransferase [Bacteroidota bacterium]